MGYFFHTRIVQVLYHLNRYLSACRQVYDTDRFVIIRICKEHDLKSRGLHVFVQPCLRDIDIRISFQINVKSLHHSPIIPPASIGLPVIGSICCALFCGAPCWYCACGWYIGWGICACGWYTGWDICPCGMYCPCG